MIKPLNLRQLAIESGMTEAEADQITNKGQIFAYQEGVPFIDALTITSTIQGNAIRSGITLADSNQFTSQVKVDAFEYINSLSGAVYASSISDAVQFSTDIQLYAYKTGYVTLAQALLYTNHEQLLTLASIKTHDISIKKLATTDTETLTINSVSWNDTLTTKKLSITQQNEINYFPISSLTCTARNAWGNTYNKRLDIALKKDLSTIFPNCVYCTNYAAGCLECLDYVIHDTNECSRSQISCSKYSFINIIIATDPSMTIATAIAKEICNNILTLEEKGVALGLNTTEAKQLTNEGQLLALEAGKTFSDAIQIQNYWQGFQIHNTPTTSITDALLIQNYGNYIALSIGIPSAIAVNLNTGAQARIFGLTQNLTFAQTYGDKAPVQFAIVRGVEQSIASQFTLLCQSVIYCAIPTTQTLNDVLSLTTDNQCKAYLYNQQNVTAATSLSEIDNLFFDNLHLSGSRCVGTAPELVCVEGIIH